MRIFAKLVCCFLATSTVQFTLAQKNITTGPTKGSLVIVGGGRNNDQVTAKFMELAGGKDAHIVVIPTAWGAEAYSDNAGNAGLFRKMGATKVTVLHTSNPKIANTNAFIEPLKSATAVWFSGGRQWRLVDSYKDTKTEKAIWDVLNRGGVVGGSSAGATIQGSYLARGHTENNQKMMGDHEEGFAFIKNIAIDQHVLARNRQFDMFDILKNKPELLGIAIDESTAVVVTGNTFEVIGKSYVLIYDGTFYSREGTSLKTVPSKENVFYFLRSGERYDMENRKVITN
ncbi:cyanophycinase [Spongiivirga citrea]|uniref:Type 1 glutamine amidotransferase-like domain-containing protein n=1 Tax=Spongiivirga citrea TaxID=1481457 RepID=A0A6M0CKQ1_9FLAO|nr:cyanophycinase [Spongiivirga citrea]NER16544.1 type 1 glutamine amidotransferase-like domain-containing protein [Spongiivirga citrea]